MLCNSDRANVYTVTRDETKPRGSQLINAMYNFRFILYIIIFPNTISHHIVTYRQVVFSVKRSYFGIYSIYFVF